MNIQPINQDANNSINFQRLIINKGSFNVLKQSKYFPDKSYPNYDANMRNFYKKLIELKKSCANNTSYDVVVKSGKQIDGKESGVFIQDSFGKIQGGFRQSFDDLFRLNSMEPQRLQTEAEEPRLLIRLFNNWNIKRENKKLPDKQVDMVEFLNSIYKNIKTMVKNADYLAELDKIKN